MVATSPSDDAPALAKILAAEFRRRLLEEQLPRIRRCVELLGDANVWRRPTPACNSVGNLLLHLAGNTTQWILAAFAEDTDRRNRPAEFAAEGGVPGHVLVDRLAAVFTSACNVVDRVAVAELRAVRTVQNHEVSGLAAILHVLEHCSGHAGQIYAWTKQVTGQDLRFYGL